MAARPPTHLGSVSDLPRGRYAAVLLDQFGCLHDGREPLPGAVDAVNALAATGARLLILSNSSRRAGGAVDKLVGMGFDRDAFAGALTSGEVTHDRLARRRGGGGGELDWARLGGRCLHLTWASRGGVSLAGLGLTVVGEDDLASADFILAHGTEGVGAPGDGDDPDRPPATPRPLDALRHLLETAARRCDQRGGRRPPWFVCANPDLVTVDGGTLVTMPGTLAAWYEAAGGRVVRLGKPAPPIYAAALAALGHPPASSVLAVGDSLDHDVAGASAAGMDSLFLGGGIHGVELALPSSAAGAGAHVRSPGRAADLAAGRPAVDPARLAALLAGRPHGQTPTYVMDYLMA